MSGFKKGQIVYVSDDDGQENYIIRHFVCYEPSDAYPYKTSSYYQEAIKGEGAGSFRHCLSVEDYHKMINQPKDKDLIWAWDGESHFVRTVRFYDARNHCTFQSLTGSRGGYKYGNYEIIPRDQWPEWAIEAYELLEDE